MKLSRIEKETVINFNEEEEFAEVYTCNSHLKNRLKEISKEHPESCRFKDKDSYGFVWYYIDKHLISIRKPWSTEAKQKAKERMLANGTTPPKRNS